MSDTNDTTLDPIKALIEIQKRANKVAAFQAALKEVANGVASDDAEATLSNFRLIHGALEWAMDEAINDIIALAGDISMRLQVRGHSPNVPQDSQQGHSTQPH